MIKNLNLIIVFTIVFKSFSYAQNNAYVKVSYNFLYNTEKFNERNKKQDNKNEMYDSMISKTLEAFYFIENNANYELYFNQNESVSFYEKVLIPEHFEEFQKGFIKSFLDKFFYTNYIDSIAIKNTNFNSKQYNVVIPKKEWHITTEQQTINHYICYKAIQKSNPDIVAWFAPDLNYNIGPMEYFGLPGLILRLDNIFMSLVCKSIEFDQFDHKVITKPKGIEINEEDFKEMLLNARKMRTN